MTLRSTLGFNVRRRWRQQGRTSDFDNTLEKKRSTIWFDLDNSPHVPLFAPVIKHYREKGIDVILTARDHSQTIELMNIHGLGGTFDAIGKHYGKSRINKIRGLVERAIQLSSHVKKARRQGINIAVAVSHGSRSMVLAAKWLGIPIISMYDYEHTETTIFNRFSDRVMVPEWIPDEVLDGIGLSASKHVKYPGIKEELYVRSFRPDPTFRRQFEEMPYGQDGSKFILAVVRPPATTANYHSKKSDLLLTELLKLLLTTPDVFTVIVPRTTEQGEQVRAQVGVINSWPSCLILDTAIDGLNLACAADLVISGGGTMNREAALLGVPVYSIFAGKLGSLDEKMEKEGLITFIREPGDVEKIKLVKRTRDAATENDLTDRVESAVKEQIDSFLDR